MGALGDDGSVDITQNRDNESRSMLIDERFAYGTDGADLGQIVIGSNKIGQESHVKLG